MSLEEDYDIDIDYNNEEYYGNSYNDNDLNLEKMNSYMILKEDQLIKERDSLIKQAMEFLDLSREDTILVLISFSWSFNKLQDEWYENPEGNKVRCGIEVNINPSTNSNNSHSHNNKNQTKKVSAPTTKNCLVCECPPDDTFSALKCNHNFCGDCWSQYLQVKSEDFLCSLSSPCPFHGCGLIVPEAFFFKYLPIGEKGALERFQKSVLRNFTGSNSDIKICPGVSCTTCIKCDSHSSKEITCLCGTVFCFKCNREAHRPTNCEMMDKWDLRSKSDTDNDKWIKANTKTCPHCKQKIEKSQGCNYMACLKQVGGCGKAFCYVCEVDWEKHSQDHFKCNMYTPQIQEKESEAAKIKAELERYKFYFDRFINYTSAVKFAEKLWPKLETIIDSVMSIKMLPLSELEFLRDALRTVISAKRTLKYTYIFGYYLKDGNEKKLFEYSQSFLERNSDNLHQMIEQDSMGKIVAEENYEAFNRKFIEFKNTIVNLCFATTKYQKNLVNEIEGTMMHLLDDNLLNGA